MVLTLRRRLIKSDNTYLYILYTHSVLLLRGYKMVLIRLFFCCGNDTSPIEERRMSIATSSLSVPNQRSEATVPV